MATDEDEADEWAGLAESSTVASLRPRQLIRDYGLREGRQVPMPAEFVQSFHDRFFSALARYAAAAATGSGSSPGPAATALGFDFDRLMDGYFERTSEGVQLVFFGRLAPGKTGWLTVDLEFDGGMRIDTRTETETP